MINLVRFDRGGKWRACTHRVMPLFCTVVMVLVLQGCGTPQSVSIETHSQRQSAPSNGGDDEIDIQIETTLGDWDIYVSRDLNEAKSFQACYAGFINSRDIYIGIALKPDRSFRLSLSNPRWDVTPLTKVAVVYTIGSNPPVSSWWTAFNDHGVSVNWAGNNHGQYNRIRTANTISVSIDDVHSVVRLANMLAAMRELEKCVEKYESSSSASVAEAPYTTPQLVVPPLDISPPSTSPSTPKSKSKNPFSSKPKAQKDADADTSSDEYWKNRMNGFADKVLTDLGDDAIKRIPVSYLPKFFDFFEVAWRDDEVIGAAMHKMGKIRPNVGAALASNISAACDGKSASRTERKTLPNADVVHRIVTKCDEQKAYTTIVTVYPLSDMAAYYVLFHHSRIPGRAEDMEERIYSSIADSIDRSMSSSNDR